jgi:hypothetical protein
MKTIPGHKAIILCKGKLVLIQTYFLQQECLSKTTNNIGIKGTVERKLTWVKSGINRQFMTCPWAA